MVKALMTSDAKAGGSEPCGKGTCQVCDQIITTSTFTTKACEEVFKVRGAPLNCNSEKVLYLLRCKMCNDTLYVGKAKTKFVFGLIFIKVNLAYTVFKVFTQILMIEKQLYLRRAKHINNFKKGRRFGNTN